MLVEATPRATQTVALVREAGRTDLVMVLSSGCCDSTAPFLYDHYVPDATAEQVGHIDGVPVLAPAWIVKLYPGQDLLTIDVVDGEAEDSFSLETDHGRRFVLRAPNAMAHHHGNHPL